MANPEGTPIWYELLTNDAAASTAFYEEVMGWKFQPPHPGDERGYRTFSAEGGLVGGMMPLDDRMRANGARPTWLFYIGVDNVDETLSKAVAAGASVLMPPFDVPNAGRMAMLTDPQRTPFYIMRGSSPGVSTSFDPHGMGKCGWNELATPDHAAANAFYAKVFGWTYPEKMPMGDAGEYTFFAVGDTRVGGTMPPAPGAPRGWHFYYRAPEIDAAAEKVKRAGGKVHAGPMNVPGGDRVIVASDAHGVMFGILASGKPSA